MGILAEYEGEKSMWSLGAENTQSITKYHIAVQLVQKLCGLK